MGITVRYVPNSDMNTEVTFKDVISENENYILVVGKMKETAYDSYLAINKTTGVIEGTQQVLSSSLEMIEALDRWLRKRQQEPTDATALEEVTENVFE